MKELKPKYVLYARKSTEDDDKQVMSIEAQLVELHEFARREQLEILSEASMVPEKRRKSGYSNSLSKRMVTKC